ncbi:MAG: response regulator [Thermostichales cyanobacterium BF3_bins_165]
MTDRHSPFPAPEDAYGYAPLGSLFGQLTMERFSGRVDLRGPSGTVWNLYFCLGRLVWQDGGRNSQQRWRRLLSHYCPGVDEVEIQSLLIFPQPGVREYNVLAGLLQRQQINREQLVNLVEEGLGEVLFDIVQDMESYGHMNLEGEHQIAYQLHHRAGIESPLTLIRAEAALAKAQQAWKQWQAAGLAAVSPNMIPIICRPDLLKQQVPRSYAALQHLINGRRSLRTLALKMQQDLLPLARVLNEYAAVGILRFAVDQDEPVLSADPTTDIAREPILITNAPTLVRPQLPTVVCIDDSAAVCQTLDKILRQLGYAFQAIQDPLQAIPILLKLRPDLIFLDLVMPIANGYEICSQIRRATPLKQTPVVILTSNDGLVDRMRASLVGATDFLAKPIEPERIAAVMNKYAPRNHP